MVGEKRIHLFVKPAAGKSALRSSVERRHAGRLRRLPNVERARIDRVLQTGKVMCRQTVAPEHHIGLVRGESEASIAKNIAGRRETCAVAIKRSIVVVVIGSQMQSNAVCL